MKPEQRLQISVCDYLRIQYPNVIFTSDIGSGMKLTIGQAVQAKRLRSSRAMPDLMIFEPNHEYKGLFIELKSTSPYKSKGGLKKDEHLQEQEAILDLLSGKGYKATFGVGFEQCKRIIDDYMKKPAKSHYFEIERKS